MSQTLVTAGMIGPNAVGNSSAAQMPANTLKGNNTGSPANAADLTVSQVQSLLGVAAPASVLYPQSTFPADTAGRLFPNFYAGGGGNAAAHDEGLGVMASLSADATWELRFPVPNPVPTGTPKLWIRALANATSGAALVTPNTASVPPGGNPSNAPLHSEAQQTLTWGSTTNQNVASAAVSAAGSGYSVGDLLTVVGGTSTTAAIVRVLTLSGSAVATVEVIQQGVYTVLPSNPVSVTGGGGSGATFTLTFDTAGDADKYKSVKVALTPAPVAGGVIVVGLTFNTTSWTLAAVSTWIPALIWE